MSSYYPSFNYNGLNSLNDKGLIVVAFDADSGEADTFLGMDCIYTEKYDGTRRIDYGAKFNSTAVVKISVVKADRSDFKVNEVRDFLKWTTGIRRNSYLDMLIGDVVQFSFLGRVTNAYQQKLDARTIGMSIEFTSVSPWAYSPIQYAEYSNNQTLKVNSGGTVYKDGAQHQLQIDKGVLYDGLLLTIDDNGVVAISNPENINIQNETDDLYTTIYLHTVIKSIDCSELTITNNTLNETTEIKSIGNNETITLSAEQFILSSNRLKTFGSTFNFVWPRLAPGVNNFTIKTTGTASIEFTYRYPIKIGDCAIDVYTHGGDYAGTGGDNTLYGDIIDWEQIIHTPTTIEGYGITNAYNMEEVNSKIESVDAHIDEQALNDMLAETLK